MTDQASRFSIKQRLRSANNSLKEPSPPHYSQSTRKILVPEHYNYFLNSVEKELKHESHIYHRIKRKIEDYRTQKQASIKVKNSYAFTHKSFMSGKHRVPLKNRAIVMKTANGTFEGLSNSNSRIYYCGSDTNTEEDGQSLAYTKSASQFVRSPCA
jgi:hypothetical protein